MNEMTVRELATVGHRYTVTGHGYSTDGAIRRTSGDEELNLDDLLFAAALCNDSEIHDREVVGDPTEGALTVLAEKGGIDVGAFRASHPRIGEIPFDSAYKFMVTFHRMTDGRGRELVRAYAKGAPDVVVGRATAYRSGPGQAQPLDENGRRTVMFANDRMAATGMRVLAIAMRDIEPAAFDPSADLMSLAADLVLVALVGEVDPPRPEAKAAIVIARQAGIRVRMITGDYAQTAAAIGRELGIPGRAITGAELAALPDEDAQRRSMKSAWLLAWHQSTRSSCAICCSGAKAWSP